MFLLTFTEPSEAISRHEDRVEPGRGREEDQVQDRGPQR